MKTSKDENWLTVGFGDIVDIKKILKDIFDNYKRYWEKDVPLWDYEIREIDFPDDAGKKYVIEIWCGLHVKVCIVRQTLRIDDADDEKQSGFAKLNYGKLLLWKKVLTEIGSAGAERMYIDTVNLYRKKTLDDLGVPFGKNPLTPDEMTTT